MKSRNAAEFLGTAVDHILLGAVSENKRVARGITMNWLAFGFSSGMAFFLSPFVVHNLGNIGMECGRWLFR